LNREEGRKYRMSREHKKKKIKELKELLKAVENGKLISSHLWVDPHRYPCKLDRDK
jgi:hypothetical protein